MTENSTIQLKITLRKTRPLIWRRILVPNSISFFDLHHIFQISMGWTNSHLFEFSVNDYTIGYYSEEFEDSDSIADANKVTLDLLLTKEDIRFTYLYDLGDHWVHDVEVEEILKTSQKQIPVCKDGNLRCPPEDCGGIPGFYNMLEILKNKKNPEYRDTKTWVGRNYNPEKIDLEKINKELPGFKKYMKHWKD